MQRAACGNGFIASLMLALGCLAVGGCSTIFAPDEDLDADYEDEPVVSAEYASDQPGNVVGIQDRTGAVSGTEQAALQTDLGWPVQIANGTDRLVIYQPQVERWEGNRMRARCAVVVTIAGTSAPAYYGVVSISARLEVDKSVRLVTLHDLQVTAGIFGESTRGGPDPLEAVRRSISAWPRSISLDRLTAEPVMARAERRGSSPSLDNTPPRIFYSSTDAVLVLIDGTPVKRDAHDGGLQRVLNTPALLLFDPAAGIYYLDGRQRWMRARALEGPWTVAPDPPAALERVKARLTQGEEHDPGYDGSAGLDRSTPSVYVSTRPAELLQTWGPPQYEHIEGTDLVYATNTNNDIFMDVDTKTVYALLSGRWFAADSLDGPWRWLPGKRLPSDFLRIDPYEPKGSVLLSIPGTDQSREALIANRIPQTATIKRTDVQLEVRYDGTPQFQPIQGTGLQYAINADVDVVYGAGRYYAVKDGVWFAADSPFGPWVVADAVPPEIYSIPPSSPLYHDRFVYVYGSTQDVVYSGYTPGYMGTFVDDDVVVYGTGWLYPNWCGSIYYGGPWTWGFGYSYGYWGDGWFFAPPDRRSWYHDWAHLHRLYAEHWHPHWPHTGAAWAQNNLNAYNRWHSATSASTRVVTGIHPASAQAAAPRLTAGARGRAPDLYAGRDGTVYERRRDGWYRHDTRDQWKRVGTPDSGLVRQHVARTLGSARFSELRAVPHAFGMGSAYPPHVGFAHSGFGGGGMGHGYAAAVGVGHASFAGGHR